MPNNPVRIVLSHRCQGGPMWRALIAQDEITEADFYLGDTYLHTAFKTDLGRWSTLRKDP